MSESIKKVETNVYPPSYSSTTVPVTSQLQPGSAEQSEYIVTSQPVQEQQSPLILAQLGDTPLRMMCPNCRSMIMTRTRIEKSKLQRLICFILCMTGLCCCSCVPYCCRDCASIRHECPQCRAHLGSHRE